MDMEPCMVLENMVSTTCKVVEEVWTEECLGVMSVYLHRNRSNQVWNVVRCEIAMHIGWYHEVYSLVQSEADVPDLSALR